MRKKIRRKRNLKTRLKNKLSFSLGKEKIIYIIIGIVLAVLVARALLWYIQKTEEDALIYRGLSVACSADGNDDQFVIESLNRTNGIKIS